MSSAFSFLHLYCGPMDAPAYSLPQRLAAEFVGTAFLLTAILGGGATASQLSDDPGVRLLIAALVTGFVLMVLIWSLGPVSGAHVNPCVTLMDVLLGGRPAREGAAYAAVQIAGGFLGAVLANVMFGLTAVSISETSRGGGGPFLGEVIAALGLMTVIFLTVRRGGFGLTYTAPAVGLFIGAGHFFTSSGAFANPAVTIARMFSDTYSGIAPASVPVFLAGQIVGTGLAFLLLRYVLAPGGGEAAH